MEQSDAPDRETCSRCGERPAINYVSYGATGKSLDLCDDCMVAEDSFLASLASEAKNARCEYCGGSPCGGGLDSFAQQPGQPMRNKWMCMTCSSEYYDFILRKLAEISEGLSSAEQIAEMQLVSRSAEIHMRKFVQNRDS